jgi:hypothetical protein
MKILIFFHFKFKKIISKLKNENFQIFISNFKCENFHFFSFQISKMKNFKFSLQFFSFPPVGMAKFFQI